MYGTVISSPFSSRARKEGAIIESNRKVPVLLYRTTKRGPRVPKMCGQPKEDKLFSLPWVSLRRVHEKLRRFKNENPNGGIYPSMHALYLSFHRVSNERIKKVFCQIICQRKLSFLEAHK